MKLLEYLFDKANLFLVALISFFSGTIFTLFFILLFNAPPLGFNMPLSMSLLCGCMASFLFTCIVIQSRRSGVFYKYYYEVEDLIKKASTVEELESIFNNELQKLRGLSMGYPHSLKIVYLMGLIEGKLKTF